MIEVSKVNLSIVKAIGLAAALGGLSLSLVATSETVADRIQPVGDLCMAGETCAAAQAAAGGAGEARSGEDVYATKCFTCHATGAAGAPKLSDAENWQARLDERRIEGLYDSAINGFKGMPAKGLCMDCTDAELEAAVDYIMAEAK